MDRYEIGDSHCGIIAYEDTMRIAFSQALAYQTGSHQNCTVTVYDRMAHRGAPDTWGYAKAAGLWGVVLHTRSTSQKRSYSPQAR